MLAISACELMVVIAPFSVGLSSGISEVVDVADVLFVVAASVDIAAVGRLFIVDKSAGRPIIAVVVSSGT